MEVRSTEQELNREIEIAVQRIAFADMFAPLLSTVLCLIPGCQDFCFSNLSSYSAHTIIGAEDSENLVTLIAAF